MLESSVVVTAGELEEVAVGYRRYLLLERGLSDATVECYEPRARRFLAHRDRPEGLRLAELTAADVSGFLAYECPRHSAASAQLLVSVVRSLLRYLYVAGLIAAPLEWAVPAVAALKGRSLPQALDSATITALLGTCDRRRTIGRRDYAILLLLSRLGLRASEVAGLRLDDVGWRAGELVVRGKGGRVDSLPLPVDVGEAVASYLRRRPSDSDGCRALFLKMVAPVGPMSRYARRRSGARGMLARRHATDGLPPTAAHRRDRDASLGRHAGGDRASAAPSRAAHDRDLRARGPRHTQSGRDAVAGGAVMTALEQALSDYLRLRRGLGYYLERDQGELERFVEFLQQAHAERISTELAVQWARMPATQHPVIWRKRLSTVRGFARYLATVDPASEIPSTDLLRAHQPRTAPHIYTEEDITDLMAAARSLPRPLAAATFATVIGLLACTGLRLREALALDRSDVDLETGVLNIPASKNHRQREVLLHPSATAALAHYTQVRDRRCPEPTTPAFFLTSWKRRPVKTVFWQTFRELTVQAGLDGGGQRKYPRPHDLRHTFAVRTLIGWYLAGDDIDRKMPALSTYRSRLTRIDLLVPAVGPRTHRPGQRAAGAHPGGGLS